MAKTKLTILKPVLGVLGMSDSDLLSYLNAVHDHMLNNPAFPNPPVDMAGFRAAIDPYTAAGADPTGDFFEVGFAQGVEARMRNAKRSYKRSIMGGRRGWIVTDETDEGGDEIEPLERVADGAPGPDDTPSQQKKRSFAVNYSKT
jgi:hypothetical protein